LTKTSRKPPVIRSTAEFAAYVGLSRSTVSRVLNGQSGLRAKNIQRVRAALEETGFTLNAHALHLRGKRSTVIGVCMENFLTPTAVMKVSLLQQQLRERGLTALIEVLEPQASRKTLQHFLSLRVGAIVFIGHFESEDLAERIDDLNRHGIPHLVIDAVGVDRANTISLDRVKAMAEVTTHLLKLGHRQFGLLGISGAFQTVNDRVRGIHQALRRHGLDPAKCVHSRDHLHTRKNHFEFGSQLGQSFCQLPHMPTAFMAVNDDTAVGALLEFQATGLRVPDDLSIVGFNNQNICLMTRPQLSSVDQQIERTVDVAVSTLLEQLGEPVRRQKMTRQIEPLFVVRGSTGPAKR
jgi:DNA-binding LacI/PurR family transcriptional regulator